MSVKVTWAVGDNKGETVENPTIIYSGVVKGLVETVRVDGVDYDPSAFEIKGKKAEVHTADASDTDADDGTETSTKDDSTETDDADAGNGEAMTTADVKEPAKESSKKKKRGLFGGKK